MAVLEYLPGIGKLGLYAGSCYTETLRDAVHGSRALGELAKEARRIRDFETLLINGSTLNIKIWLQLSKADQGKRLRDLRADPMTAWRVTEEDWHHHLKRSPETSRSRR